ncbi:hypothetical protein AAP_05686 [Ascosphaera apis ARSEF 7405]|uniref:Uncharacterized protein n=1 Tax=Ascosphaera apis ARSEF 7405 TaxID=392613 RepID=A0A162I1N4_9EURO|nr:hypothetical protein AAP_05686 [Ascosphaera apis ARSEF 7405]
MSSSAAASPARPQPSAVRLVFEQRQPATAGVEPAVVAHEELQLSGFDAQVVASVGPPQRPLTWAADRQLVRWADLPPQKRVTVLTQIAGTVNAVPCSCCARRPRWLECVSAPAYVKDGSCAACRWHNTPARCSLRSGPPASPRKRRPDASVYRELREEVEKGRFVRVEGLLGSRDEEDWDDAELEAGRVLDLIRLRKAKFAEDKAWD